VKKYVLAAFLTVVLLLPLVLAIQSSSGLQTAMTGNLDQEKVSVPSDIIYWETVQFTDNEYYDQHPQIHNGMITWEGYDGNDWEIFFHNGTSIVQVTDNEFDDENPQIHNGTVTWMGDDGNDGEIYLYNGTSVEQITDNSFWDISPQIHDDMVTWLGYDGNDLELFLYNGTSIVQVTDNEFDDENPQIHNGTVTWMGWDGNDYEIYLSDGVSVLNISANEFDDESPQIHNGMVTWVGWDGFDYETYLYNGTSVIKLSFNTIEDCNPQIHNGIVAWYDYDGAISQMWLYNHTSQSFPIQITHFSNDPFDPYYPKLSLHNGMVTWHNVIFEVFLYDGTYFGHKLGSGIEPQIHNGMVTWEGYDGDQEIFLWRPDATPPVIDHPIDVKYEELTTGHSLSWNPFDSNPHSYNITRNGIVIKSGPWTGETISTNIDALSPGLYTFVCTVYDGPGLWSNDTVFARVFPRNPLWVFGPIDQVIAYGEPLDYQLAVVDPSGILGWSINDTEHFELTATYYYDGSTAQLTNKVSLPLGVYGISVVVTDFDGYTLSGAFNVIVSDSTSPEWEIVYPPHYVELGEEANFVVSATDTSGLDQYWVDDAKFTVDLTGRIRSVDILPVGEYGFGVFVNDTYGNTNATYITVIVEDTTTPSWVSIPSNQELLHGVAFFYQLEATDLSGIDSWHVNDTESFTIMDGLITNATVLNPGIYGLEVSVADIYGNTHSYNFSIRVIEDTATVTTTPTTSPTTTSTTTPTTGSTPTPPSDPLPPIEIMGLLLSAGGFAVAIVIIVVVMRRRN